MRRYFAWRLAVATYISVSRQERFFGLVAHYEAPLEAHSRVVAICQRNGFSLNLVAGEAEATLRGYRSDWRKRHGLGWFQAPTRRY